MKPDLNELERLAVAATPETWTADKDEVCVYGWNDAGELIKVTTISEGSLKCDAAFIAASRTAIPALVARVRELEGLLRDVCHEYRIASVQKPAELWRRIDAALEAVAVECDEQERARDELVDARVNSAVMAMRELYDGRIKRIENQCAKMIERLKAAEKVCELLAAGVWDAGCQERAHEVAGAIAAWRQTRES